MNNIVRAVALSALIGFSLAGTGPARAQTREPFKIGVLVAMTGPGALGGLSIVAGVKAAVKDMNEKGGILGRPLEVVVGDDAGDPAQGVNEARRLAEIEKVKFVLGSINSSITLAAMPIFTKNQVMQFSATGAKEATPERGPYHFSTISSDANAQAVNFTDYAKNIAKVKSFAILSDNTPLYKSVVESTREAAAARGLTVTGVSEFDVRTVDMTPNLLALRKGNPDFLWVVGILPGDAANAMKNLKDLGWNVPLGVGLGAGAQARGMLAVLPEQQIPNHVGQVFIGNTYCTNTPLGEAPVPKTIAWLKANVPDYDKLLSAPLLAGYDTVQILKQVYTAVGSFDTVAAVDWIERNSDKIQSVTFKFSKPGKTSHFLVGADGMAMAENPYKTRADGLAKRTGC